MGKVAQHIEDGITANIRQTVSKMRDIVNKSDEKPLGSNFDLTIHTIVLVTLQAIQENDTTKIKTVLGWDDATETDFKKAIQELKNNILFAPVPDDFKDDI